MFMYKYLLIYLIKLNVLTAAVYMMWSLQKKDRPL